MSDERRLDWPHGRLAVQRLGAMLAPVTFRLPDGRGVSPLHVAPWAGAPGTEALPGVLRRLRGEWPCVPFGYGRDQPLAGDWAGLLSETSEVPHGEGSNREWTWEDGQPGTLALSLDHLPGNPIRRLDRVIRADPVAPAVDLTLTIHPARDIRLPIGLHPVFRIPDDPPGLWIDPGPGGALLTFPGAVAPGVSRFLPATEAPSLDEVPLIGGGHADASRLPLPWATEELLQIAGAGGRLALDYPAERFRCTLEWDAVLFPSLLLWFSNRGLADPPWSGRHLALGVEPVAAAFDLGTAISTADNPIARRGIATAAAFRAGVPVTTHYRIAVAAL
jgi:hypothetical protein